MKSSFLGGFMNFVYKGNSCYIYYKLKNGKIFKHRIVPKNAAEGIWVNPYMNNPTNNIEEEKVSEILFMNSNDAFAKDEISVKWENISFNTNEKIEMNYAESFFNKTGAAKNNILNQSFNDFEFPINNWFNVNPDDLNNNAYSGNYACTLQPNSLSATYSFSIDSLQSKELFISANCWVKSEPDADVLMVISIENGTTKKVMNTVNIKKQIINFKYWNNVVCYQSFNSLEKGNVLKVHLVNIGQIPISYDNFSVRVEEKIPEDIGTFFIH